MGFTVNVEKSQLVPVIEILYLGFLINSIAITLHLPADKLMKIVSACKALLAKHQPSVRDVAKVTVSALPAVNYRSLELCKTQTLSGSLEYDTTLSLSSQARSDLQWSLKILPSATVDLFRFRKLIFTSRVMQV